MNGLHVPAGEPTRGGNRVSDQGALKWHTSSFCDPASCVEVAVAADSVYVRNSQKPTQEPLAFDYAEWNAFLLGVRNNEFDVKLAGGDAGA
ncbi:DUF397 domain-containing protein [Catenulispora sp. MAP5-51]|uniref:DUF397 domain-containing protein n=1 Tax=Catenulispora sp. MAP5-51 TaxID=3156298 RepID=UPI003515D8A2